MNKDVLQVKIGSMYYRIAAREDPEYMQEIARQADEMVKNLKDAHIGLNDTAAAVLALLNALDAARKQRAEDQASRERISDQEHQVAEARAESLRLREQLWEVKKDLLYYKNLCDLYEERLMALPENASSGPGKAGRQSKPKALDLLQRSFSDGEQ